MDITDLPLPRDRAAEEREAEAAFANDSTESARQLLEAIHKQLECPARNTTMHRQDGSVIISADLRKRVAAWLNKH